MPGRPARSFLFHQITRSKERQEATLDPNSLTRYVGIEVSDPAKDGSDGYTISLLIA